MLAGVDGCRGGWVVALAESWPLDNLPQITLVSSFKEVLEVTEGCNAVGVDMPIGLPDAKNWPRLCDIEARKLLGPKASSRLFYAPPRDTLQAGTANEFQRLHLKSVGKKATLPVYRIVPKLREVDFLLTPNLQERIVEFYPEFTWMRLQAAANGIKERTTPSKPLPSKHTQEGLEKRIELLKDFLNCPFWGHPHFANYASYAPKPPIKLDDLLDAMIGLMAAQDYWNYKQSQMLPYPRLPAFQEPPLDIKGLRMEIWY